MKTRFICILAVFIAAFLLFRSNNSGKNDIMNIALDNIEAMADSDEGGGVRTARCGKNLTPTSDDAFHYKCNASTSSSMMYKCPSNVSKGEINSFEGHFSCML